jgi:hypothetical protein
METKNMIPEKLCPLCNEPMDLVDDELIMLGESSVVKGIWLIYRCVTEGKHDLTLHDQIIITGYEQD